MELTIDQPFDLGSSLESGQAHRWEKVDGWYYGVVREEFIQIRQRDKVVEFSSGPSPEATAAAMLRDYFRFDDDLDAIYSDIVRDDRVAAMVNKYPGLRILRTEPWECLVAFICSANNNIARIHQLMERMSEELGRPLSLNGQTRYTFPSPADLVEAGESELRRLGLGFRAPYVDQAASAVLEGKLDLAALVRMPYPEAKAALMEIKGIGSKIADCVAVFSLEKLEAFPIDVWIRRALSEWYFPGQKTPPDRVLLEWAQEHFGRYGGYSQQYLFHGQRLRKKSES
ncbi:MAG: DNA glycosylase [Chloroflexi bacterium]|nr:DNA glycosylase [Chloroflexota bacterium]